MPAFVNCSRATDWTELVSATTLSVVSRSKARAPATSGWGGNELILSTISVASASVTASPFRSATIRSAACCAVLKSTYSPDRPPTNASWSICANHCPLRAAEPKTASNEASSALRSSNVSLTSKATTLVMSLSVGRPDAPTGARPGPRIGALSPSPSHAGIRRDPRAKGASNRSWSTTRQFKVSTVRTSPTERLRWRQRSPAEPRRGGAGNRHQRHVGSRFEGGALGVGESPVALVGVDHPNRSATRGQLGPEVPVLDDESRSTQAGRRLYRTRSDHSPARPHDQGRTPSPPRQPSATRSPLHLSVRQPQAPPSRTYYEGTGAEGKTHAAAGLGSRRVETLALGAPRGALDRTPRARR